VAWLVTAGLAGLLLAHPALYSRTRAYAVLAGMTGLVWLLLLIWNRRGWHQFDPPRILGWPAVVMLLGAGLSILFNADAAWRSLWLLISQMLFLWVGWWLATDSGALRLLGGGLLGGAALAGLYAGLQHYHLDPLPASTPFEHDRIVSFFANPNHLGNYLGCALPLALAGFLQAREGRSRAAFYALVGLTYGGLLLAASRGAWWAALVGCLVVGGGQIREVAAGRAALRLSSLVGLAVLLVGITLLLAQRPVIRGPLGQVSMAERVLSSRHIVKPYVEPDSALVAASGAPRDAALVRDSTINHRYFIWRVTWEMIRSHPLFGLGYGNYQNRFAGFRDAQKDGEHFKTLNWTQRYEPTPFAHNEYLHFWAESGILGLAGFISLVVLGLQRAVWRALRVGTLYLWGALGLAAAMLVHSLVSYPLRLPLNGMIFWILFGIIFGWASHSDREKSD